MLVPLAAELGTTNRTCAGCRSTYPATIVDGRDVSGPYCPECAERIETEPDLAGLRTDVRSQLDGLGVNVRRHGQLALDELGDSGAVTAARDFVQATLDAGSWSEVRGLYLHGPTGTGKSQIAVSAIRALLDGGVRSTEIVYDRGRAMVTQLQDRYGTGTVDAFSEVRRRARVWVYEDAGTEKLTADAFRVLEDVFDRREGHPTLVTSNYDRETMAQRWNDQEGWQRLRSRLSPFQAVEVSGADRRFGRSAPRERTA